MKNGFYWYTSETGAMSRIVRFSISETRLPIVSNRPRALASSAQALSLIKAVTYRVSERHFVGRPFIEDFMNIPSLQKPAGIFSLVLLVLLTLPLIAIAGSGEEANAVIDRWSAAYSSNDPEAVTRNYRPDAILLGTFSPAISQGTDAIRAYFSDIKGSGAKNSIGERYTWCSMTTR
jgi:hypothetical protein